MPHGAHLTTKFAMSYQGQVAPEVAGEVGAFAAALGNGERRYSHPGRARQPRAAVHGVATATRDDEP